MTARELTWHGLTASYTPGEQAVMRAIADSADPAARRDLELIHEIKAELDAHLLDEQGAPL